MDLPAILYQHAKKQHLQPSKTTPFSQALKEFGDSVFVWEILFENYDRNYVLTIMEPYYIQKYNTIENGYNVSKGGLGVRLSKLTEDHKEKLSESRKIFYASESGKEWKKKLSDRLKGNKLGELKRGYKNSEETKQKMSKAKKGCKPWHTGKTMPDYMKKAISAAKKGKKRFYREDGTFYYQ